MFNEPRRGSCWFIDRKEAKQEKIGGVGRESAYPARARPRLWTPIQEEENRKKTGFFSYLPFKVAAESRQEKKNPESLAVSVSHSLLFKVKEKPLSFRLKLFGTLAVITLISEVS